MKYRMYLIFTHPILVA